MVRPSWLKHAPRQTGGKAAQDEDHRQLKPVAEPLIETAHSSLIEDLGGSVVVHSFSLLHFIESRILTEKETETILMRET